MYSWTVKLSDLPNAVIISIRKGDNLLETLSAPGPCFTYTHTHTHTKPSVTSDYSQPEPPTLPQAFERNIRASNMGAALGIKASEKGTDFMKDMGQTAIEVGSPLGQCR